MKSIRKMRHNVICTLSLVLIPGVLLLGGCGRKDDITKDASSVTPAVTAEAGDTENSGKEAIVSPTVAVTESPNNTEVQEEATATPAPQNKEDITYSNTDFGFDFNLPASWEGYTIQTEDWQGIALEGEDQGKVVETGKKIMIRHPEWTEENPRQDIPVMVFTLEQWEKAEKEEIAVSAAPVGPTELGRNTKYVFALPPRYNFAFPTGYEEVDQIIQKGALKATENYK